MARWLHRASLDAAGDGPDAEGSRGLLLCKASAGGAQRPVPRGHAHGLSAPRSEATFACCSTAAVSRTYCRLSACRAVRHAFPARLLASS